MQVIIPNLPRSAVVSTTFALPVAATGGRILSLMMRRFLTTVILLLTPFAAASAREAPSDVYRSVLRIEVASQVPDYATPWNAGRFGGGIGTGFIIGNNRILTNAHVVSNGRRILVTVHGSSRKYPARIEHIAHDCDLALLAVDDFSDFTSFPVFTFGEVPRLESQVRVIGYPIGGERLSVTRGVVSRIDFQPYSHSRADSHLTIQIDAAINPGNSGGPVLQDEKVVGVAFQGLRSADNTGYVIPTPVIRRFLKDIEDGRYEHYVDFGINEFELHNPAMRRVLGLPADDLGVLVTHVIPGSGAEEVLRPGDVLAGIDGIDVDSAGQVEIGGEHVNFNEIIERKFTGDRMSVRFLREGTWHDAELTLKPIPAARMQAVQYDRRPRYIVFAGLVFQPLDTNLFAAARFDDVTVRRLYTDYVPRGLFRRHRDIVVLSRVESDPVTSQLGDFAGFAVDKINGTEVIDLKHAYELLHGANPPEFHVIELFGATRPVVIPSADVAAANERVARHSSIPQLANLED